MRKLGRRPSDEELAEAVFGVAGADDERSDFEPSDVDLDFTMFVTLIVGTATRAQRCLQQQLSDFRESFDLFDEDGGGTVDLDEFVKMMEMFGHVAIDSNELKQTVAQFDGDDDGELNFVDFIGMMVSEEPVIRRDVKSHLVGFREAFNLFDSEGRGVITDESFLRSWREYGFQATDEQVIEMLKIADEDGSGELEFDEFVHMVAGGSKSSSLSSLTDQIRGQLSELREIFSLFDPDGDGTITNDEIGEVLRLVVGMDITDEQVGVLTMECDEDGNGEIDFAEFAGMMAKNHNPPNQTLIQRTSAVPLGPATHVLKQDPDTRGSEDINKVQCALENIGIDFFEAKKIDPDVARELYRQMSFKSYKPFQAVIKQNESAVNYCCVLSGSVLCWQRNTDKFHKEPPPEAIKDFSDPTVSKKTRAKAVAQRRGSIAGPSSKMAPPKDQVTYEPSVWCVIERTLKDALRHVRTAIKDMPSNLDTPAVKKLTELLAITSSQLFSWVMQGQETIDHDLEDMRTYLPLLQDGAETLQSIHTLYLHADKVRREQLLVKFYLQLSTYASDQVKKLEPPYAEDEAEEYITTLEEENAPFLVASARTGYPIVQCSPGFTELTGYTREEVMGKNARLLQGEDRNTSVSDQIKRHLKGNRKTDLTVLTHPIFDD